ncbi:MAG: primosomal replication protein N [Orrella sp.]
MNNLVLSGRVVNLMPLRYTPAAVPVMELDVDHEHEVEESGVLRLVKFEMAVTVIGDLALMNKHLQLGQAIEVEGFLAPTRKNSPRLRLHAQRLRLI